MKESAKISIVVNEVKNMQREAEVSGQPFTISPLQVYLTNFGKGLVLRLIISLSMIIITLKAKLITILWAITYVGSKLSYTPEKYVLLKLAVTLMWMLSILPYVLVLVVTCFFSLYLIKTVYILFNIVNKLVLNWEKTVFNNKYKGI